MHQKISKYFYFTICFAFFVFATLYLSDLIVSQLLHGFSYTNDLISLNYVENTGAAFSILQDSREVLIIASVVAICGIVAYIIRHISTISMKAIFFLLRCLRPALAEIYTKELLSVLSEIILN